MLPDAPLSQWIHVVLQGWCEFLLRLPTTTHSSVLWVQLGARLSVCSAFDFSSFCEFVVGCGHFRASNMHLVSDACTFHLECSCC